MSKNVTFEEWEAKLLSTPGFQKVAEELEPGYQVARLRMQRGLTQKQLADLLGTKQSSIARLESGNSEPSLSFLRRVVQALGAKLEVKIIEDTDETKGAQLPETGISVSNWPVSEGVSLQKQIAEEKETYSTEGTPAPES